MKFLFIMMKTLDILSIFEDIFKYDEVFEELKYFVENMLSPFVKIKIHLDFMTSLFNMMKSYLAM